MAIFCKLREAVGVVAIVGVPLWRCLRAGRAGRRTRQAGTAHIVLATLGHGLAQALVPRANRKGRSMGLVEVNMNRFFRSCFYPLVMTHIAIFHMTMSSGFVALKIR